MTLLFIVVQQICLTSNKGLQNDENFESPRQKNKKIIV